MEAEGSTKVPTMVISTKRKFHKKLKPPVVLNQLVHFVDWMPTILELANYKGMI